MRNNGYRSLLVAILAGIGGVFLSATPLDLAQAEEKGLSSSLPPTPDEGIKRLIAGNQRYVENKTTCPDRHQERRLALYSEQRPFAVVLGCSDSRVSPEIIFDQGIGDLFVVRVAGNVVGELGTDSIEYGIHHLGASVIMVLGHENCGAVAAVAKGKDADIPALAVKIRPAVTAVRGKAGDSLENAIKRNVANVVQQLKAFPLFRDLVIQKKLAIIGGYHHLHSGHIELLPLLQPIE